MLPGATLLIGNELDKCTLVLECLFISNVCVYHTDRIDIWVMNVFIMDEVKLFLLKASVWFIIYPVVRMWLSFMGVSPQSVNNHYYLRKKPNIKESLLLRHKIVITLFTLY